jgi:hypothetical protein
MNASELDADASAWFAAERTLLVWAISWRSCCSDVTLRPIFELSESTARCASATCVLSKPSWNGVACAALSEERRV